MEAEKQERQAMLDESKTYTGREICRWAAHECLYHTLALGLDGSDGRPTIAGWISLDGRNPADDARRCRRATACRAAGHRLSGHGA